MHLYKIDGFDLILQKKNTVTNMPDLWDSTYSITNRKRASHFQTPLKDQYLFKNCLALFSFFLFFPFKRQEEYLKFIFMQNEDQRIVGSTCWYKDALGSSSFKRKISLPGPTCELQGCSLGLAQGIQGLEQLIWLILFAVAGATGLNSLACFKHPGKTISDYLILHLLICDVSVFPKMLMEMSWNRLYQHNV